jgi:hypothetical protein
MRGKGMCIEIYVKLYVSMCLCGEFSYLVQLSGKRDSNPLPTAWEAVALPGELFPLDL